jgi:hypothetical protein
MVYACYSKGVKNDIALNKMPLNYQRHFYFLLLNFYFPHLTNIERCSSTLSLFTKCTRYTPLPNEPGIRMV